jgi:hypothetical protein
MKRGRKTGDPENNRTMLVLSFVVLLLAVLALSIGDDNIRELISIEQGK